MWTNRRAKLRANRSSKLLLERRSITGGFLTCVVAARLNNAVLLLPGNGR